jgi:hypothetical protein
MFLRGLLALAVARALGLDDVCFVPACTGSAGDPYVP